MFKISRNQKITCFFETYTTYDLYFKYILYSSSLQRIFFSNIYQMQLIYDVIVQHKEKFV